MPDIRIISDGTPRGTVVYSGDKKLTDVFSIEIQKIIPDNLIIAEIGVYVSELDVRAEGIIIESCPSCGEPTDDHAPDCPAINREFFLPYGERRLESGARARYS